MKLMKPDQIPAFVADVLNAGCDICAIGHDRYVLGDIEEMDAAANELTRIDEAYGDRDFLKREIVAHLRSLGRYLDIESTATHWTEYKKPN